MFALLKAKLRQRPTAGNVGDLLSERERRALARHGQATNANLLVRRPLDASSFRQLNSVKYMIHLGHFWPMQSGIGHHSLTEPLLSGFECHYARSQPSVCSCSDPIVCLHQWGSLGINGEPCVLGDWWLEPKQDLHVSLLMRPYNHLVTFLPSWLSKHLRSIRIMRQSFDGHRMMMRMMRKSWRWTQQRENMMRSLSV